MDLEEPCKGEIYVLLEVHVLLLQEKILNEEKLVDFLTSIKEQCTAASLSFSMRTMWDCLPWG